MQHRFFQFFTIGAIAAALQPTQIGSKHYEPYRFSAPRGGSHKKGSFAVRTLQSLVCRGKYGRMKICAR